MSHLCFISTSAALRLSTSAPGNNYLARAHPLTSWLGTCSARPGLCLLSALSRQLNGFVITPVPAGPVLGRGRGSCRPEQIPPEGEEPSRAQPPGGQARGGGGRGGGKPERLGRKKARAGVGRRWGRGRRGRGDRRMEARPGCRSLISELGRLRRAWQAGRILDSNFMPLGSSPCPQQPLGLRAVGVQGGSQSGQISRAGHLGVVKGETGPPSSPSSPSSPGSTLGASKKRPRRRRWGLDPEPRSLPE